MTALKTRTHAGKVFTLTTGCSQARWSKMVERLQTVSDSFTVLGY